MTEEEKRAAFMLEKHAAWDKAGAAWDEEVQQAADAEWAELLKGVFIAQKQAAFMGARV